MTTIEKIIEQEKKMPNPNHDLIKNLEDFISTGKITIKASDSYACTNSDEKNYKKNIK
jgi:hypothetical protein